MRFIIGTVITFIILVIFTYTTLSLWGIKLSENLTNSLATFGLTLGFSLILTAITAIFFKISKKKEEPLKVKAAPSKE